jgi:hypothetical protein
VRLLITGGKKLAVFRDRHPIRRLDGRDREPALPRLFARNRLQQRGDLDTTSAVDLMIELAADLLGYELSRVYLKCNRRAGLR